MIASAGRAADPTGGEPTSQVTGSVAYLQWFVFALFFTFGGITSLNDVLIPKLKSLFRLNYAEVMLIQTAFFAAYLLFSLPAAQLVQRTGYMRGAVIGLLIMTLGCLMFIPASHAGVFLPFLGALFVLAAGITVVQVVSNPLISMLGAPRTASSRLTFAQAFNSLGTTVFPYVGAILILGPISRVNDAFLTGAALQAYRTQETNVITKAYLGLAIALTVVAGVVWFNRKRLVERTVPAAPGFLRSFTLLKRPRFAFGAFCIFIYVGAEVAIASLMTNYLMQPSTFALAAAQAGRLLAFYWGGAMIGRFIGAAVLRRFSPAVVLSVAACAAILLLGTSAATVGVVSGVTLLAIGCCNAIMFPTIFTLASEGLGDRTAEGSGVICMAIFGGAVVPILTGWVADHSGLRVALAVPALCYVGIALFGRFCSRREFVRA
jgi:FHS family L-fucose permease-like MFS transporter